MSLLTSIPIIIPDYLYEMQQELIRMKCKSSIDDPQIIKLESRIKRARRYRALCEVKQLYNR